MLVIGHPSCVLARRIRPPSLESYKDPAGVRGRRILYRILSRLLLVLYIGVGIVLPSEIIGLHWRRIRPDPGPDPHLKCHRIRRIRLDLPRMRGRGAPDPHLKGHRIRRIRLGLQRVGRPSAVAPHLKGHRIRRIRLSLRRVGRPSAVAPHRNCHPFHGLRLGWRTIDMPGVRCATQSRKVLSGLDGYPAFARTGVHKRSARQGAFGRGCERPVSQTDHGREGGSTGPTHTTTRRL